MCTASGHLYFSQFKIFYKKADYHLHTKQLNNVTPCSNRCTFLNNDKYLTSKILTFS